DEVAGRDLVAEALADLGDAERRLAPGGRHDVEEVDEDALCGLGPQIVQAALVLHRTQVGLHETVEHPWRRERAPAAAVGTGDLGQARRWPAVLGGERLLQLVGAEPPVAGGALGERDRKSV